MTTLIIAKHENGCYCVTIMMDNHEGKNFFEIGQFFPDRNAAKQFVAMWNHSRRQLNISWVTA